MRIISINQISKSITLEAELLILGVHESNALPQRKSVEARQSQWTLTTIEKNKSSDKNVCGQSSFVKNYESSGKNIRGV